MISDFIFEQKGEAPTKKYYDEFVAYVKECVDCEEEGSFAWHIYNNVLLALIGKDTTPYRDSEVGYLMNLMDAFVCYLGWTSEVGLAVAITKDFNFFKEHYNYYQFIKNI